MIEMQSKINGKIGISIKKDGELKPITVFNNLVTNSGLDLLGTTSPTSASTYCFVGSGTTAPSTTDTTLVTPYTGTAPGQSSADWTTNSHLTDSLPYYVSITRTYTFDIGEIVGNVSEIGFFNNSSPSKVMFSRALIKDTEGNPTTITILADEQLVVTYEVIRYLTSVTDVTGSITLGGTSYSYTLRPCNLDDPANISNNFLSPSHSNGTNLTWLPYTAYATQTLGNEFGRPTGTTLGQGTAVAASYSNGTYYRDATVTWGPSDVTTSIGSLASASSAYSGYQIAFTPVIPKTSINQLQLTFRHSWDRYVP